MLDPNALPIESAPDKDHADGMQYAFAEDAQAHSALLEGKTDAQQFTERISGSVAAEIIAKVNDTPTSESDT